MLQGKTGSAAAIAAALFVCAHGATAAEEGERRQAAPVKGIFTYSLPSAIAIDVAHQTVTLPLHLGRTRDGAAVWYVITDSSDQPDARRRGVNYASKLLNALGTAAVQEGLSEDERLVFAGTVDFSHKRVLVPDPINGFPPLQFAPGARADARYSPLVRTGAGGRVLVLNAPHVANASGRSGSVVDIDFDRRTVTLSLIAGWVDGQFNLYLHTEASAELVAALENSAFTPNLNAAPGLASNEPPSARAAITPVVNGPRGDDNPQRQGLQSALLGEGDPLNIAQEQPSDPVHYTPIWDVSPVAWTQQAINSGLRYQLHSQDAIRTEALAGNIVSALPGTPNKSLGGINSIGAISNCPIIATFPGGVSFEDGVK